MRYLVTDDSKLARRFLIKLLENYIHVDNITEATNGFEALEMIKIDKPDVVFLDLTMPIMDGYEALPKILEMSPNTRVIVVSADVQCQAKEKVLALGAYMHVEKPIDVDKIKEIFEIIKVQ